MTAIGAVGAIPGVESPPSASANATRFDASLAGPTSTGSPTRAPAAEGPAHLHPAARFLGRIADARRQLDHVLRLAESGRTFSPAELLALQARTYRASLEIDLASKAVEKAVSGAKQVLQTQI